MKLRKPIRQDEALREEIQSARREARGLHLWWLGQSGFLVLWEGRSLLLDPYLSDSLTRKYALTDQPHVRISERVIAPERLDFIDVVTSSHNHTDHLDPETLRPLARANPRLVMICPEANRVTVRERSELPEERIVGLDSGNGLDRMQVGGFEVHAIPAAHETLALDALGRHLFLGWVVRAGPWTLYHSGDTVLYPGMVDRLRPFRIDLALLPINGRAPERRVAGNLSGKEAAQLARAMGAGRVIPCHFDLFAFNTASPEEFTSTCGLLQQPYQVLRLGEQLVVARDQGSLRGAEGG